MNLIHRRRGNPSEALSESPPSRGESIIRPMTDSAEGIRRLQVPKMVQYVREYTGDPDVTKLARRIVSLCEAKDRLCEMNSLFLWTKNHMRYVSDPVGKETIATPTMHLSEIMTPPSVVAAILGDKLLEQLRGFGVGRSVMGEDLRTNVIVCKGCFRSELSGVSHSSTSGDCDEGSTFLATLLASVGIVSRFRFGGQEDASARDGCNYHHVWVQGLGEQGEWVDLDVTEKKSKLGWFHDRFGCTGVAAIFPDHS
ncbi:MAG: transglutaminase domain-containing protein [Vicinamibacteria bacterium]